MLDFEKGHFYLVVSVEQSRLVFDRAIQVTKSRSWLC